MSKTPQILVYLSIGVLAFFINMADVSSGSYKGKRLSFVIHSKNKSSVLSRFKNTNPSERNRQGIRDLASDGKDSEEENKKIKQSNKDKKENDSYSKLDPNLYEGSSEGASDLSEIYEINNELSR